MWVVWWLVSLFVGLCGGCVCCRIGCIGSMVLLVV